MTKLKQLEMSLMSFIQGKRAHGLGEYSALQAGEHFPWGILGKREFYGSLEAAADETAWLAAKLGISLSSWQVRFS